MSLCSWLLCLQLLRGWDCWDYTYFHHGWFFGTWACMQDTELTELPPKLYACRFWKISTDLSQTRKINENVGCECVTEEENIQAKLLELMDVFICYCGSSGHLIGIYMNISPSNILYLIKYYFYFNTLNRWKHAICIY